MYRTSLVLRVVGHPCLVLAFCFCLIYNVPPVDATSSSEIAEKEKDTKGSEKVVSVPQQTALESTTDVTEKLNGSDVLSEDTSSERTHAKPASNGTSVRIPLFLTTINSGALERTGFVALGIMSIVLFFFVIRAVRIRRKRSKSRKYGIITSTVSDMEMEPLDRGDDDEEETTLFDAQHQKYSSK